MEEKAGFTEMFLRLVAIVGLIAVLILGAWGIILLAFNLVGIFTGSVDLKSLFTSKTPTEEVASTPTVTTKPASNTTSKPATGTVTSAQPTAVYTAAPRVAQLYGMADLKVTITSVNSLSAYQGRTVVQFTVENAGTNVALSGWSFNAQLPMTQYVSGTNYPVTQTTNYTYQSQPQQALYPGDSIAYTLTYDDPNYRSGYTYQQYNNTYNYQYQNTGTCYTFNGYQNIPGPCPLGYDSNGNPLYGNTYQYNYNQPYYNPNYNYNYNQNTGYRTVTVMVDPQNWVPESVEYNNSASKNF